MQAFTGLSYPVLFEDIQISPNCLDAFISCRTCSDETAFSLREQNKLTRYKEYVSGDNGLMPSLCNDELNNLSL